MSVQSNIDSLLGGTSVFNLALTAAGIIQNKKNVALYILNEKEIGGFSVMGKTYSVMAPAFKQEIFQPIKNATLNRAAQITGIFSLTTVYMSAEITQNSKLMEHPVEDGTVAADFKVRMPTEITVRITLPAEKYNDILADLQRYKDDGQMIYIETKFGNFKNMQIVSIPVNLTVDNVSRLTFSIKFKEVLLPQTATVFSPAGINDTDTVNLGTAPTGLNVYNYNRI